MKAMTSAVTGGEQMRCQIGKYSIKSRHQMKKNGE